MLPLQQQPAAARIGGHPDCSLNRGVMPHVVFPGGAQWDHDPAEQPIPAAARAPSDAMAGPPRPTAVRRAEPAIDAPAERARPRRRVPWREPTSGSARMAGSPRPLSRSGPASSHTCSCGCSCRSAIPSPPRRPCRMRPRQVSPSRSPAVMRHTPAPRVTVAAATPTTPRRDWRRLCAAPRNLHWWHWPVWCSSP